MKNIDQYLNEDGYPTEEALNIIEKWDWKTQNILELFLFIRNIWHGDGWKEEIVNKENRTHHWYKFSTYGWSGNEDIIEAFKKNRFIYDLCFLQYRRGGHYEFDSFYLDIFEMSELEE